MQKLTAIFRGCGQDGIDHYTDYAITRNIPLTEEQQKLLTPPQGMTFSELILEEENKK
jgi:hypothetical protein